MKCHYCNKEMEGRSDKLYCDRYCKAAYHYELKKKTDRKSFYKKVDLQLKTNRKILKHFNVAGYTTIKKELLFSKGFDPNFFTHYWKNQKGQVYLFCFEYGFLSLSQGKKDKYLIIQWQDYMNK